jgi:ribosomal 50S subunit-associated protein YjgA (DUF615 family)
MARSHSLERDRIARLSVEERILMALGLRERFAGLEPSPQAEADIVELLKRNPDADRAEIRMLCRRYRLSGLEPLIREADTTG